MKVKDVVVKVAGKEVKPMSGASFCLNAHLGSTVEFEIKCEHCGKTHKLKAKVYESK